MFICGTRKNQRSDRLEILPRWQSSRTTTLVLHLWSWWDRENKPLKSV
nr:MAG TPA: hypothetical protein [Caudoviricetes sp.]